jgi:hypothetical protein
VHAGALHIIIIIITVVAPTPWPRAVWPTRFPAARRRQIPFDRKGFVYV